MSTHDFIGTLVAAFVIALSWTLAASALAGEPPAETVWLWSETAPASHDAATALGDGHLVRGLRLAETALEQARNNRDRMIAHHNLCIIHAARGRYTIAETHCQSMRDLAAAETGEVRAALDALDANLIRIGAPGLGQAGRSD